MWSILQLLVIYHSFQSSNGQDVPLVGEGIPPRVHQMQILGDLPVENYGSTSELSLQCTASGNPLPKIEWSFNGVKFVDKQPFSGVEGTEPIRHTLIGGILKLKDVRGKTDGDDNYYDTGRYRCIASNDIGSVFKEMFIKIRVMGKFKPDNQFGDPARKHRPVVGQRFKIACPDHVKGYGTTVRWGVVDDEKNIEYWLPGHNPRVFQTVEGEFVYSVVLVDDIKESRNSGGLRCILINFGLMAYSNQQVLYEKYDTKEETRKPEIMAPLEKKMTATIDTSFSMICGAVGFPVPKYRWEYQGMEIKSLKPGGKEQNFEFFEFLPNKLELKIRRITQYSGGTFKCYAENDLGVVWTIGQLSVAYPPKFTTQFPASTEVPFENYFQLVCNASGFPKPKFEWFHNSTQIVKQDIRRKFTGHNEGDNGATLTFVKTEFSDNGIYICVAINNLTTITQSTFVKVQAMAPKFVIPIDDPIYLFRTANMQIPCQPFAGPKPTRTWTKDGVAIVSGGRYHIHENGSLEIKNVRDLDKGVYKCIAENSLGKAESQGSAMVLEPTVITNPPLSQGHQVGYEGVNLFCGASWDPHLDLRIEWYKGGVRMAKFSDRIYLEDRAVGPPRVLYIRNLTIDDAGNYTCHAFTTVGNVISEQRRTAYLTIKGPPEPPAGVYISSGDCDDFDATLNWQRGEEIGVETRRFYIEFSTNETALQDIWYGGVGDPLIPGSMIYAEPGTRVKFQLTKRHLVPGASLIFRIRAASDHLIGLPSRPSRVGDCVTPEAKPPLNPLNVTAVTKMTPNKLFFTWRAIRDVYYGGPGFYYEVGHRLASNTGFTTKEIRNLNVTEFEIPTPTKNEFYEFYVHSINSVGKGPEPEIVRGKAGGEPPTKVPQNFRVKAISRYSVELGWDSVDSGDTVKSIIGYKVRYWNITDAEHLRGRSRRAATDPVEYKYQYFMGNDAQTGGSLSNITAQLVFLARVAALSSGGVGPESDTIEFESQARVPGAPHNVAFRVFGQSAHLSWNPPLFPNGYIEQYEITWQKSQIEGMPLVNTQSKRLTMDRRSREAYLVDTFEPLTYYGIKMLARNRVGPGADWEHILVAVSADDVPGKPGAPKTVPFDDSAINVTFQLSTFGGLPTKFYVYYRPRGHYYETALNISQTFPKRAWILVKGLEFAVYDFWTVGINALGQSETSDLTEQQPIRRPKPQAHASQFPWYRSNWFIAVGLCLLFVAITMFVIIYLLKKGPKTYRSLKEEADYPSSYNGGYPHGTQLEPMSSKTPYGAGYSAEATNYDSNMYTSDGGSDHDAPPPRYSDQSSYEKKSRGSSRSGSEDDEEEDSRSESESGSEYSETGSEVSGEEDGSYYSDEEKKRDSEDDDDDDAEDTSTFV